jgi:hypothetical protein
MNPTVSIDQTSKSAFAVGNAVLMSAFQTSLLGKSGALPGLVRVSNSSRTKGLVHLFVAISYLAIKIQKWL